MIQYILLILLMFVGTAQAATFYPCSPVFIAGPQGRPIPNAVVSVVNLDGSPIANGVWLNSSGTQPFINLLPADQVLQVFADPGIYRTDMSGAGLTKTYEIVCGTGVGSSFNTISIDRTADLLLLTTALPPTKGCVDNYPCLLTYLPVVQQFATYDFRMPASFPLTFKTLTIQWAGAGVVQAGARVVWVVDWCVFKTGEIMCDPSLGGHTVTKASTVAGAFEMVDATFTTTDIPAASWVASDHVVVMIKRDGADPREGVPSAFLAAELLNVQMEFSR